MHPQLIQDSTLARTGVLAATPPLLCVLHCLAAPLLVLVAPSITVAPGIEFMLMVVAGFIATAVVGWGIRSHGEAAIGIPVLAGLVIWLASELAGAHGATALAFHAMGGVLMSGGLAWNAWIRHGSRGAEYDIAPHPAVEGDEPEEPLAEAA